VNDTFERKWEEAVVACFIKILSHNLPGRIEENHGTILVRVAASEAEFVPRTSRICDRGASHVARVLYFLQNEVRMATYGKLCILLCLHGWTAEINWHHPKHPLHVA